LSLIIGEELMQREKYAVRYRVVEEINSLLTIISVTYLRFTCASPIVRRLAVYKK
jgi:hypothetical protein